MARIKLSVPGKFNFSCSIPVRITDLNYGGHVGNDTILSILHEARMQFLKSLGYTEMNFSGKGMIMADLVIEFKSELFYGDQVIASVAPGDISRIGVDLFYKLEKENGDKKITVALAKTAMICYDYENKKIAELPDEARMRLVNQ